MALVRWLLRDSTGRASLARTSIEPFAEMVKNQFLDFLAYPTARQPLAVQWVFTANIYMFLSCVYSCSIYHLVETLSDLLMFNIFVVSQDHSLVEDGFRGLRTATRIASQCRTTSISLNKENPAQYPNSLPRRFSLFCIWFIRVFPREPFRAKQIKMNKLFWLSAIVFAATVVACSGLDADDKNNSGTASREYRKHKHWRREANVARQQQQIEQKFAADILPMPQYLFCSWKLMSSFRILFNLLHWIRSRWLSLWLCSD